MENLQYKTFNLKCNNVECDLIPVGSTFFVAVNGKVMGQKNKKVSIGQIENLRIIECYDDKMQDLLADIAEKLALN